MAGDDKAPGVPKQAPVKTAVADMPLYFDTTVAKLVKGADGEWVEVMSDNLYPGERLKRSVDAEKAAAKAKAVKPAAKNAK